MYVMSRYFQTQYIQSKMNGEFYQPE